MRLRLGTRGSRLALAQAESMKAQLESIYPDLEVEICPIKTSGDRGDREVLGAFVREIQHALLENSVDFALHCLKDLPTEPVPGLTLSAYLSREDVRDGFISRGAMLEDLPANATVGTGSVRRTSQLAARRPDLKFKPLVGNVDTRLRKLIEGEYDAIILAVAGLKRLGLLETWSQGDYRELTVRPLETDVMLPAPGQAVLVLETREGDPDSIAAVAPLHHPLTASHSIAERAFLRSFGGGCSVPVAAFAEGESIRLTGLVASPDGKTVLTGAAEGSSPTELGLSLAEELKAQGAQVIVDAALGSR